MGLSGETGLRNGATILLRERLDLSKINIKLVKYINPLTLYNPEEEASIMSASLLSTTPLVMLLSRDARNCPVLRVRLMIKDLSCS